MNSETGILRPWFRPSDEETSFVSSLRTLIGRERLMVFLENPPRSILSRAPVIV